MYVKICSCGRLKLGQAWINCPCAQEQLLQQGVEHEVVLCDTCEKHHGAEAYHYCDPQTMWAFKSLT